MRASRWAPRLALVLAPTLAYPVGARAETVVTRVCARVDRWVGDLVSPGTLALAHAELEGVTRCGDCHAGLERAPDALCLDCHEVVGERQSAHTGHHGRVEGRCAECHAEHRGADADLSGLDRDAFNHERALFALRGAHLETDCEDCHLRPDPETGRERFTALGLAHERCADCHEDPHPPAFAAGRDCGVCHGEAGFRWSSRTQRAGPEPGFDHARDAGFALAGRHASVACDACHDAARRQRAVDAGLPPDRGVPRECAGCHEDPHRAALSGACESCHSPRAWAGPEAPFDHGLHTDFPLDGVHAPLACQGCHADERFQAASDRCEGCHEPAAALLAGRFAGRRMEADPHRARLACGVCHGARPEDATLLAYERACVRCHTPEYASLLLSRRRILDDLVVRAESGLRRAELELRRGEADPVADAPALAARVAAVARSGAHHPALAEAILLDVLERLARPESEQP